MLQDLGAYLRLVQPPRRPSLSSINQPTTNRSIEEPVGPSRHREQGKLMSNRRTAEERSERFESDRSISERTTHVL